MSQRNQRPECAQARVIATVAARASEARVARERFARFQRAAEHARQEALRATREERAALREAADRSVCGQALSDASGRRHEDVRLIVHRERKQGFEEVRAEALRAEAQRAAARAAQRKRDGGNDDAS